MAIKEPLEVADIRPPINEIIVVEQLPVIREQLELMRAAIQQDVDAALSLVVTENTVKEIKAVRSRLNGDYKTLEKARIDVKKKILTPYEQFETIYKECISSVYGPADDRLKQKIDEVEDGLKQAKQLEIEAYFNEYCLSKNIDFLTFTQSGVVVNLSASKKRLKAQAKTFVDKVAEELEFISSQDNAAEVLVEYKKSLNAVQAMAMVSNRHKALAVERQRLQQTQQIDAERANVVQRVEQAVKEEIPTQEPAAPASEPLQSPVETAVTEQADRILTTRFTVRGTKPQLLALRRFLLEGGYEFE